MHEVKIQGAIDAIKRNCIRANIYITDAYENPYCGLVNKVFCDEKKERFEKDAHDLAEKYKDIGMPTVDQSTEMLGDTLDLCQKYEFVKSDGFVIPSDYLHITMGKDDIIETFGISTTRDHFSVEL